MGWVLFRGSLLQTTISIRVSGCWLADSRYVHIANALIEPNLGFPDVSPLAKIGNASKTSLSKPLNLVRGVFDLEVRRKPQAFAADAVSLWILNQSPLIINGLALYAKPHFSGPYSLSMAQSSVHGACGFVSHRQPGRYLFVAAGLATSRRSARHRDLLFRRTAGTATATFPPDSDPGETRPTLPCRHVGVDPSAT
jgi:hypothetical protein